MNAAFIEQLLDAAPVVLFSTDKDGVITFSRGSALHDLGLAQDELVGQSVFSVYPDEPTIAQAARQALDGETVSVELHIDANTHCTRFAPMVGAGGAVERIVGVSTDITAQTEAQRSLERFALFDSLTGLPNRLSLNRHIDSVISREPVTPLTVAVIGLNRFREINHTFGYETGDSAIIGIGRRIAAEFQGQAGEYCARSAGDEFSVAIPGGPAHTLPERLYERLARIFREPVSIRGQPLAVEVSTGVAFFPGHGGNADILLRRADTAMHVAKQAGLGHAVYNRHRDEPRINNVQLIAELRGAIERNECELHFQPQVNLATGRISGAEALFRWHRLPTSGIDVQDLIQVAERSGVIYALDTWVLNTAIESSVSLARGRKRLPIAVNISARSIQRSRFAGEVVGLVDSWGIAPADLRIEVTETAIVHDHVQMRSTCARPGSVSPSTTSEPGTLRCCTSRTSVPPRSRSTLSSSLIWRPTRTPGPLSRRSSEWAGISACVWSRKVSVTRRRYGYSRRWVVTRRRASISADRCRLPSSPNVLSTDDVRRSGRLVGLAARVEGETGCEGARVAAGPGRG